MLFESRLLSSLEAHRERKLVKVHKPHSVSAICPTYSQPPLPSIVIVSFADKQIWFSIHLIIFSKGTCWSASFFASHFSIEPTNWKCWKCNMSDGIAAMVKTNNTKRSLNCYLNSRFDENLFSIRRNSHKQRHIWWGQPKFQPLQDCKIVFSLFQRDSHKSNQLKDLMHAFVYSIACFFSFEIMKKTPRDRWTRYTSDLKLQSSAQSYWSILMSKFYFFFRVTRFDLGRKSYITWIRVECTGRQFRAFLSHNSLAHSHAGSGQISIQFYLLFSCVVCVYNLLFSFFMFVYVLIWLIRGRKEFFSFFFSFFLKIGTEATLHV